MPGAKLKAAYSIPELARMSGMHRHKVRRLLEANGVELGRQGRVLVVYLSALKRALPDLWEGILDRAALE
jgi:hypothetical protein